MKQIFLTGSILANAVGQDVTPKTLSTANFQRLLNGIGISGATVNTLVLHVIKNNLEICKISNGVTRTAGQPIDLKSDLVAVNEMINDNENLSFLADNLTGGNLTAYIGYDCDEAQ